MRALKVQSVLVYLNDSDIRELKKSKVLECKLERFTDFLGVSKNPDLFLSLSEKIHQTDLTEKGLQIDLFPDKEQFYNPSYSGDRKIEIKIKPEILEYVETDDEGFESRCCLDKILIQHLT